VRFRRKIFSIVGNLSGEAKTMPQIKRLKLFFVGFINLLNFADRFSGTIITLNSEQEGKQSEMANSTLLFQLERIFVKKSFLKF